MGSAVAALESAAAAITVTEPIAVATGSAIAVPCATMVTAIAAFTAEDGSEDWARFANQTLLWGVPAQVPKNAPGRPPYELLHSPLDRVRDLHYLTN